MNKPKIQDKVVLSEEEAFDGFKKSIMAVASDLERTGAAMIASAKELRSRWDSLENEYNKLKAHDKER